MTRTNFLYYGQNYNTALTRYIIIRVQANACMENKLYPERVFCLHVVGTRKIDETYRGYFSRCYWMEKCQYNA